MNDERSLTRILVVGHSYVAGVNQAKLAAISRTGRVIVGLLVPSRWTAAELGLEFPLERAYPDIPVYAAPVPFVGRGGAYVFPPHVIHRAFAEFRPRLVHVEQEVFSLSAFQLALGCAAARVPLSLFCWENTDRHLAPPRRWTRRFVLRQAELIVAGNTEAGVLLRKWGYRNRLAILPQFGVDLVAPVPASTTAPGNRSIFTVGFVGRLVYAKGVDILLDAVALLNVRGRCVRVVVVGSGPEEAALRARAVAAGLEKLVEWRGAVRPDEVGRHMADLDALVLPSRTVPGWKEQFGRVLIEAMAMGIPVVGSRCGAIPEVIGRADLVFPEGDAETLAAILDRLITDRAWWAEVRTYGLQRVRENFTNEAIARRLVALWEGVLSGRHR